MCACVSSLLLEYVGVVVEFVSLGNGGGGCAFGLHVCFGDFAADFVSFKFMFTITNYHKIVCPTSDDISSATVTLNGLGTLFTSAFFIGIGNTATAPTSRGFDVS
jgi:hypothetical protein